MKKILAVSLVLFGVVLGALAATRYPLFSWNSAGYSFTNATYNTAVADGAATMNGTAVTWKAGPNGLYYSDGSNLVDFKTSTTNASTLAVANTLNLQYNALEFLATPVVPVTFMDLQGNTHTAYGVH